MQMQTIKGTIMTSIPTNKVKLELVI